MDDVKQVILRLQDQKLIEESKSQSAGVACDKQTPVDSTSHNLRRDAGDDGAKQMDTDALYGDKLQSDSTSSSPQANSSNVTGAAPPQQHQQGQTPRSLPLQQIISDRMNVDVSTSAAIISTPGVPMEVVARRPVESTSNSGGRRSMSDEDLLHVETDENSRMMEAAASCCRCSSSASSPCCTAGIPVIFPCAHPALPPTAPALSTSDDEVCDVFFKQPQQLGPTSAAPRSVADDVFYVHPTHFHPARPLSTARCTAAQLRRIVAAAAAAELTPRPWLDFNKMQKTCLAKRRSHHHRARRIGRHHVASGGAHSSGRHGGVAAAGASAGTPGPTDGFPALDPAVFSFRSIWLTRQQHLIASSSSSSSSALHPITSR